MEPQESQAGKERNITFGRNYYFFFNELPIMGCLWPLPSGRPNVDPNCVDGNQCGKGGPQENQGTVVRGKVER